MLRNTRAKVSVAVVLGTLLLAVLVLQVFVFRSSPSVADVPYSQNVQAVGEAKYVQSWTSYGPRYVVNFCEPRSAFCAVVENYSKASRGTATVRLTTFKVTERIRAYDYYLLDFDVTTSWRSGTGDGGTGTFKIRSTGPKLYDRNDSKAIDAQRASCTTVAVEMSTPWPLIAAGTTVGHATMCDKSADLTRSYSGSDAIYEGRMLASIRHLTMQRWVKVAHGSRPSFALTVTLPRDTCTNSDAQGHCTRFSAGSTTKSINLGTTG
ncbi:MAG: hypothetical protein JWQ32_2475 [Marmoricola sp.]|nr:hypothetical protein [Marmoricola sp.]